MDNKFLSTAQSLRAALIACLLLPAGCATPTTSLAVDHADLQFVDRDGKRHGLDGKPAAFIFWQPWCSACREEAPAAVAASADLDGAVAFYGVVSGPDGAVDEDLVDKSIDELGLSYPQVRDKDLQLAERFGVDSTPMIVVLDGAGKLRFRGKHLPHDWSTIR